MAEEWKPIPGYEGLYDASNLGRIRSAPGKTTSSARFQKRVWKSRIMKFKQEHTNKRGDYRVSLWKDGIHKDWLVARLIAMAWHGVPEGNMTVNHINGDPTDNRAENLDWCSLSDNIRHGFNTGLFDSQFKAITIFDNEGNAMPFLSMADANRFLGRCHSYVSDRVKSNKSTLDSVWGERFTYKVGDLS